MRDGSRAAPPRRLALAAWLAVSSAVGLQVPAVVRYLHPGPTLFSSPATLKADDWFARLVHEDDYLLAIRHARLCLEANPDSVACRRTLGISLARSGQREAALREYREYLKRSGDEGDWEISGIVAKEDWRFMN